MVKRGRNHKGIDWYDAMIGLTAIIALLAIIVFIIALSWILRSVPIEKYQAHTSCIEAAKLMNQYYVENNMTMRVVC